MAVVAAVAVAAPRRTAGSGPLPASVQVVRVTMREYGFDFRPPAQAGRTVFRVHNAGREGHRFGLFPLPEDMPPIDQQIHGPVRRTINPLADVPQNRATLPAGGDLTVAVDLVPGRRYAILDLNAGPDGRGYASLGMDAEFRASGAPTPPPTTSAEPGGHG